MSLERDYPRQEGETESEYRARIKLEHEIDHKYGISPQQRRDRAQTSEFDDSFIIKTLPYTIIALTALTAIIISYFNSPGNEATVKNHLWGQLICVIATMVVYNQTDEVLVKESKVARTIWGGAFAIITYVLVAATAMDIFNQVNS